MTKNFWKSKLLPFLEPSVDLGPEIYDWKGPLKVAFWFEGGLKVVGGIGTLGLSFSDADLMILSTLIGKKVRIYRVHYSRLVCFELISGAGDKTSESTSRFLLN